MDSSFLFLPFGNDLLVVIFVARNHGGWPLYVLSAVCGSTLGVLLLDIVARKAGETGIRKMAGPRRFEILKRELERYGAWGLAIGCIAPPPFPFTMAVAVISALHYPRKKLLAIVAGVRALRFVILSLLAVHYGRNILRLMNTDAFKWTMIVFACLCIVGSVFSAMNWVKGRHSFEGAQPKAA